MRAPGRPWVAVLGWSLWLIAAAPACTGDEERSRDTGTATPDGRFDLAPDKGTLDAAHTEAAVDHGADAPQELGPADAAVDKAPPDQGADAPQELGPADAAVDKAPPDHGADAPQELGPADAAFDKAPPDQGAAAPQELGPADAAFDKTPPDAPLEVGPADAAGDSKQPACGCKPGQYCVRYFDGTCQNLGFKCKSLPSSCFPNVCLNCPDLACGKSTDGSNPPFIWGCGYTCGKDSQPPLPFDIDCYGP